LGPCDLLLSLNPWRSPAIDELLARLAPNHAVGFFSLYDERLPLDYSKHTAELAFDMVRARWPEACLEQYATPPRLPESSRLLAARLRANVPPKFRVLAVHADTGEDKMWPAERWLELLDRFLPRHPEFVVFVLGGRDLGLDACASGDRVIPCLGLPLAASLSLVGEADLFAGVDSCKLHAADLFRVPGVGLFGPTRPEEFGFRFARHQHVTGDGSMSDITVEMVDSALEALISQANCRG
jgi:ADP-heptose:LPS heptosyltransferase